jgi:hypothetical protein
VPYPPDTGIVTRSEWQEHPIVQHGMYHTFKNILYIIVNANLFYIMAVAFYSTEHRRAELTSKNVHYKIS